LGGGRGSMVSPLPLEDGGVVVATENELDALDASGSIRARAALPKDEILGSGPTEKGSLLAAGGRVIAVAKSGVVFAWSPGRDLVRVGSFGGEVDGGATVLDDHTLIGVVDHARIVALDIDRNVASPRTAPTIGMYFGPLAVRQNVVYGQLQT